MNTVSVNLYADDSELAEAICNYIVSKSIDSTEERGRFSLAVTADRALFLFAGVVTKEPFASFVNWRNWWIFFIDDYCLPLTHSQTNYKKVNDALLQHISIPEMQVFPAYDPASELDDKGSSCESAALNYEKQARFGRSSFPTPVRSPVTLNSSFRSAVN